MTNRLAQSIDEFCRRYPVDEKWLLVPSYRVGYQWLENTARGGCAILNLHLKTLPSLALEMASRAMEERGLRFLRGLMLELLVGDILSRSGSPDGYLLRYTTDPDLASAVCGTLLDLRLAGLAAEDLDPERFEPPAKGKELANVLRNYQKEICARGLADYAEVLRLACEAVQAQDPPLPPGVKIAMPREMEPLLKMLEKELWNALPSENKELLEADRAEDPHHMESDASLLRWIHRPHHAPSPRGDGTVEIFRATGEINEVREILRRCLKEGIPFDRVEILHTDYETYVPHIFELCALLFPERSDDPPVTFAEGVPVRYSRPGRAVLGWIYWIREDFSQSRLVHMIQDGLLVMDLPEENDGGFSRLGALFRTLPIGQGRQRYDPAFRSAQESTRPPAARHEEENDDSSSRVKSHKQRELEALHKLCERLLAGVPENRSDWRGFLNGAEDFLVNLVRSRNKLDEYSRQLLLERLAELRGFLPEIGSVPFQFLDWMEKLVRSSRILGEGPRPGCLYVAPLLSGGHSGRPFTFILGLDDRRFPGAGLQDPLLLDHERERLSPSLATASGRLAASMETLSSILAGIRGRVTLSYSCYDLQEDREMFPSQALVSAFRIISGRPSGTQEDLLRRLPPPASFAAVDPGDALLPSDWWVSVFCGERRPANPEKALACAFPHLARGLRAARARASEEFTPYDGYVPEAGLDLDPTAPGGPVISPSRLELYGRCPLEYFFRYVLEITPPEEYRHDPHVWLEATERGTLLHSVFRKFHQSLKKSAQRPSLADHWKLMEEILDKEIALWRRIKPPPSTSILEEESAELARAARIFLQEEELCCRERRPIYFEVAVGAEKDGHGNPIDVPEPLEIDLPDGTRVRVRGYIDRVDQVETLAVPAFLVCDYKTGSSGKYDWSDPFRQGRCIQNYLYKVLAENCLRKIHPDAEVVSFEFFFPSVHEHGERISWESELLSEGIHVLQDICRSLSAGCFPISDDPGDLSFSDYLPAFGEVDGSVSYIKKKLANERNRMLQPLRRLRGYEEGGK